MAFLGTLTLHHRGICHLSLLFVGPALYAVGATTKMKHPWQTVNSTKTENIPILKHKFWMFRSEFCTSWPLNKYLLTCRHTTVKRCVHENKHAQHLSWWPWAPVLVFSDYCFLICKRYSAQHLLIANPEPHIELSTLQSWAHWILKTSIEYELFLFYRWEVAHVKKSQVTE